MIGLGTRVRLASKARLRLDDRSGKQMLLYPERGLELSASAARIAGACAEPRTAGEIVEEILAEVGGEATRARIEAEVLAFLGALEDRGLLVAEGEGA